MTLGEPGGDPAIRYGFYLRPSAAMSRAQAEVHELLRRQFGLRVGGQFMPHATIMGFHKTDAPVETLREVWRGVANRHAAFPVHNAGVIASGKGGLMLDVQHLADGSNNDAMTELHLDAMDSIEPLRDPEDGFIASEWARERFRAHLTLAMADIPSFAFEEIEAFVHELGPIGPESFTAEYVSWYAFRSEGWGGEWWHTMEWRLLDSWRLGRT